jgi:hypothetical protein
MTESIPIQLGIEYGQVSAGLSAALGVARGYTDYRHLQKVVTEVFTQAEGLFGAEADRRSAEFPHMFEWGGTVDEILTGRPNRLWYWVPVHTGRDLVATLETKQAQNAGYASTELQSQAGGELSPHLFPDKAAHMETNPVLSARAGVQKFTERLHGGQPRTLVYLDNSGQIKYGQYRRWRNEFYGKFEQFFEQYFAGQVQIAAEKIIFDAVERSQPTASSEVQKAVASATARPRIRPGAAVTITDEGKPARGIRIKESIANRVAKKVGAKFVRELRRTGGRGL